MNEVAELFDIPKVLDKRGNLSFVENGKLLRFDIKRAYWIYDVPGGEIRGEHAFVEQKEVIIALSGSFDVVLNDGKEEFRFHLNRSYTGLYVPNLYWRRMENFSTNAVCMVLSSTIYDEEDYIWDFDKFLNVKNEFNNI